jgi:hypothetical protein
MGSRAGGGCFEALAPVRQARRGGSSSRVSGVGMCSRVGILGKAPRTVWWGGGGGGVEANNERFRGFIAPNEQSDVFVEVPGALEAAQWPMLPARRGGSRCCESGDVVTCQRLKL